MLAETTAVQGAEVMAYLKPVLLAVLPIVGTYLTFLIIKLVDRVVGMAEARLHVKLSDEQHAAIQAVVVDGVALAEQLFVAAGHGTKSNEKMEVAVDYVKNALEGMGMKQPTDDQIKQWVEITLAQLYDPERSLLAVVTAQPKAPRVIPE